MSKIDLKLISKIQAGMLVGLLVYAAYFSAQGIWFLIVPGGESVIVLPGVSNNVGVKVQNRTSQLSKFHLFGEVGKVAVRKSDEPTLAPKTHLRLLLKGVFTSEHGGKAGAIVQEIGRETNYYGIGATLPGNAVLEEVYSDRILLRRNGRLETLSFEDKSQIAANKISKEKKSSLSKKKRDRSKTTVGSPKEFMNEATRRLADDPIKALGSVGLAASSEGYVYQGGNPMLAGLNLQKGDVIKSVNGHPLGDVKKDKALMTSFYEQGSLEVEIARDGASFYINYPLR